MLFEKIVLKKSMYDALVQEIRSNLPTSTQGVFIARTPFGVAEEYHVFKTNIRNSPDWKPFFESYGAHHAVREDTGYVVDPGEMLDLFLTTKEKDMVFVGVFHTHKILPAVFTAIDKDLHVDSSLWHVVISVVNPEQPEIRAYSIDDANVYETPITFI